MIVLAANPGAIHKKYKPSGEDGEEMTLIEFLRSDIARPKDDEILEETENALKAVEADENFAKNFVDSHPELYEPHFFSWEGYVHDEDEIVNII